MNAMGRIERISSCQLDEHLRQPHIGALKRFLTERGYASHTVYAYVDCVAHFSQWAERTDPDLAQIDETVIAQFLDEHLPHCKCGWPTRSTRRDASAALGHLLLVLRTLGITAAKAESITPVEEELRRFDEHMEHVRGLAPGTRRITLRIVRELLRGRFRDRPVVFSAITPEQVRSFFSRVSDRYRAPTSATALVAALRGYFRFRALAGDPVHALIGILSYPANWQQASLPKALADEEIARLLKSLDSASPSMRRSAAIVRCAVDLGLRSGEIAALSLDDVNWRCSTLTLRNTKSRREQVLPLPEPTGRAIAAYLKHERPKVAHRGLFVRRMAPHDDLIGPDLVRKTIRQAYERAGLPYTRSHLLRHTMASRLLAGGSSLKEVADVLRHRSLNTTLIYAKLDSRNLREVALPWPGSGA
jgi:site-specific recombinase XerD